MEITNSAELLSGINKVLQCVSVTNKYTWKENNMNDLHLHWHDESYFNYIKSKGHYPFFYVKNHFYSYKVNDVTWNIYNFIQNLNMCEHASLLSIHHFVVGL